MGTENIALTDSTLTTVTLAGRSWRFWAHHHAAETTEKESQEHGKEVIRCPKGGSP